MIELLEAMGAPIYGFSLDDESQRAPAASGGCRAWPGYVQV